MKLIYPYYVLIEGEIPVKIVKEGVYIKAYGWAGKPYPPVKAISEGRKISQDDFKRLSKELAAAS